MRPTSSSCARVCSKVAFHSAWHRTNASLLYCSVACFSLRRSARTLAFACCFCCACISLRKPWTRFASAICRSAWYYFSLRFMSTLRSSKLRERTLLSSRMGRGELVSRRVGLEDLLCDASVAVLTIDASPICINNSKLNIIANFYLE